MFGAICGDILGSTVEFDAIKYPDITDIQLCREADSITDDSALTFAVADWLLHDIKDCFYDDETLKQKLAKQFVRYALHTFPDCSLGLGANFFQWCCRAELTQEYEPYNSFGNGSGMRVSPVGWYFETLEETLRFAKLSADVTHNHPEGEKGAMCIAAAIFLARKGTKKEDIKAFLLRAFGYELLNKSVADLRADCRWSEICQDTVPMAVAAFLESRDYETAIRLALSYGGDSDTIAAMTGAIAEACYGPVPHSLAEFCKKRIPDQQLRLIEEFYADIHEQGEPYAGNQRNV